VTRFFLESEKTSEKTLKPLTKNMTIILLKKCLNCSFSVWT